MREDGGVRGDDVVSPANEARSLTDGNDVPKDVRRTFWHSSLVLSEAIRFCLRCFMSPSNAEQRGTDDCIALRLKALAAIAARSKGEVGARPSRGSIPLMFPNLTGAPDSALYSGGKLAGCRASFGLSMAIATCDAGAAKSLDSCCVVPGTAGIALPALQRFRCEAVHKEEKGRSPHACGLWKLLLRCPVWHGDLELAPVEYALQGDVLV